MMNSPTPILIPYTSYSLSNVNLNLVIAQHNQGLYYHMMTNFAVQKHINLRAANATHANHPWTRKMMTTSTRRLQNHILFHNLTAGAT